MVQFTDRTKGEWVSCKIDPTLASVFLETIRHASDVYGLHELTVTSIWRSAEEDAALEGSGVHVRWGALDLAVPGLQWDDKRFLGIATHVNMEWSYDHSRPNLVVALFKPHASAPAPHLHLQTHQKTRRRK